MKRLQETGARTTMIDGATLDVRVANLFDRLPSPNSTTRTNPYQYDRSFWVGLNYRF